MPTTMVSTGLFFGSVTVWNFGRRAASFDAMVMIALPLSIRCACPSLPYERRILRIWMAKVATMTISAITMAAAAA